MLSKQYELCIDTEPPAAGPAGVPGEVGSHIEDDQLEWVPGCPVTAVEGFDIHSSYWTQLVSVVETDVICHL